MVKRNGHYGNGRQRWLCNYCHRSFHASNQASKQYQERIWFRRWIQEGYSVRQLSDQSGHSLSKLYRIIDLWLFTLPPVVQQPWSAYQHLLFDGTFLHRPVSIAALMDASRHMIIAGQHGVSENSESQLLRFFTPLKALGLHPQSCTVDGNPQVIRVLQRLWPEISIQRCLVHIQRQGLMWCRRNPKLTEAKKLRQLFLQVTSITTPAERDQFLQSVAHWEAAYGRSIQERKETGWVFPDVKRARSMLLKALPHMFHYLADARIPATTNGLEGYFSRLKRHYRNHRGLQRTKRTHYFSWYFYLKKR